MLLSAPSILIGLFVYEFAVEPFGGFSGIAGCIALAIIVIPIVVRTTEDMLRLITPSLREAAIGAGRAEMEGDRPDLLPSGDGRDCHRRAAGGCAHRRGNRAAAVYQPGQSELVDSA